MKLVLEREMLKAELKACAQLSSSKSALPATQMVLISAVSDSTVNFTATDLETSYQVALPADIKLAGAVCVASARLRKLVNEMEGDMLELSSDEKNVVKLSCGACEVKLYGLPADDFPVLFSNIEGVEIKEVCAATLFSPWPFASDDETRHILNGVAVQAGTDGVRGIATDGRRLAVRHISRLGLQQAEAIIPTSAAKLMAELGEGTLRIGAKAASFTSVNRTVITKLIEGVYPNWRQVVPSGSETTMIIPPDLAPAVHRVALVAETSVKLTVQSKGKIRVAGEAADIGRACETVEAEVTGNDVELALNPAYLLPALSSAPSGAAFEFTDSRSPVVLKAEGYIAVIMPLRLS